MTEELDSDKPVLGEVLSAVLGDTSYELGSYLDGEKITGLTATLHEDSGGMTLVIELKDGYRKVAIHRGHFTVLADYP